MDYTEMIGLRPADPLHSWARNEMKMQAKYLTPGAIVGVAVMSDWAGSEPADTVRYWRDCEVIAAEDAGLTVDTGREIFLFPWHAIRSIRLGGGAPLRAYAEAGRIDRAEPKD